MRSCAHEVPTVYILRVKKEDFHNVEKVTKNDLVQSFKTISTKL